MTNDDKFKYSFHKNNIILNLDAKLKADVHVVIVNWRNYNDTITAVDSILRGSFLPSQIIIVDNDSQNESLEVLIKYSEDVKSVDILCIGSSHNLGFGGANNLALRYITLSSAGYVWLLNPDTVVDTEALFSLMKGIEEDHLCGAIGSKILYYQSNKVQTLGGGNFNHITGTTSNIISHINLHKLDFITAASILIRKEVLLTTIFDEKFFLYWEDVDLSLRIREQGWNLRFCEDSIIYHKESSSLGKRTPIMDFYFTQSSIKFYKKHVKNYLIPTTLSIARRLIHRIINKKLDNVKSIIKAIRENVS